MFLSAGSCCWPNRKSQVPFLADRTGSFWGEGGFSRAFPRSLISRQSLCEDNVLPFLTPGQQAFL